MGTVKRSTIGVIFGYHLYEGSHPIPFAFPIIRGIQEAAREKNINLMIACGVARQVGPNLHRPAWPELDPETDFVPVGPWNTDGLIFVAPLRSKERIRYARKLVDDGFPVFVLGADSGYPAIVVDNEGGIRQVMEHLIQHGHHEIAFIAGDEQDIGDTAARVLAYRKIVQQQNICDDPRLLEYGQHWRVGGYNATQRLIQSGVKFTAVMCSNDMSALGAMQALREAGIRIPWDVAVAGFDDVLESLAQVPPLTSVHYPLFETGYRALLMLHKRIEQPLTPLPELTRVATWLVPRQSCGCLPDTAIQSAVSTSGTAANPNDSPQQIRDGLAQRMLEAVLAKDSQAQSDDYLAFCERLVDGFLQSLEDNDLSHFQNSLTEVLQRIEMRSDDNANLWQAAVTVLRQGAHDVLKSGDGSSRAERAEDILHQARTILSESADRRYTRLQVNRKSRDESMGLLTARLISSSEEDQLYTALREDLPQVGVRTCHVVFFEPQGKDPVGVSLLRPLESDAPAVRFNTRHFPPPDLYPQDEPFSLALLPLFYQDEKLGYVAFDGGNLDPLATLVRQLSSTIKNVQLHAQVRELSLTDGLTGVHNRRYFEIILQKETERTQRYKRDLAVIIIDIDFFKGYNDAFGHPAGDEALKEIAECITLGARRGLDVVTRYGGEEFAIILPETNAEGAWIVAEKVRNLVENDPKFLQHTTVSLGIGSLREGLLQSQILVDQADRSLYQAKRQGRNRSVIFEDWMQEPAHSDGAGSKVRDEVPPQDSRPE
ncbi:MAG: GGDEF domain-containing protein [Anaerolineales bacterium]